MDDSSQRSAWRRNAGWRIAAIAWATKIFWLSTAEFRSERSGSLLRSLLDFFHADLADSQVALLHTAVRKGAHLLTYLVFGFLVYRSILPAGRLEWNRSTGLWAVAVASAYSVTDELHQSFVAGRTASASDCLWDIAGAALAIAGVYGLSRFRPRAATGGQQSGVIS